MIHMNKLHQRHQGERKQEREMNFVIATTKIEKK
jgi:hypothetical protein